MADDTLAVAAMGALYMAFVTLLDAMVYPWAHSLVSTRTLTGGWYGPLRATHGNRSEGLCGAGDI